METLKALIAKIARPAELLLAAVFLAGAFLKAADINRFIIQISHYGVLENRSFISLAALATVGLEMALGVALIVKLRLRGLLYLGSMLLLVGFTGLILYGWLFNDLKDCGCFGAIEMSPEVSVAKNVLLAVLVALAWVGLRRDGQMNSSWRRLMLTIPAVLLAALTTSGYSYAHVQKTAPPEAPVFAEFVFNVDGKATDLGKGTYLVAILSMTCDHCMETVPAFNELQKQPGVPALVGLCYEEAPGALEQFTQDTAPEFPMFSIGSDVGKFFSLIGSTPPRIALVRDGVQVHYWDEEVPQAAEVVAALAGKSNDASE